MESFRAMVKGWLGKTLLVLIALVMAGTGIEMYFAGSRVVAAKVNGTKIDSLEVDRQTERQRQQLIAQMGPNADPSLIDVALIRKAVLDDMINRELLSQQAQKNGFLISDATVMQQISEVPAFQRDGKFDRAQYEMVLRQNGENPATFFADARRRMGYALLLEGLNQSGLVTTAEMQRLSSLEKQTRDLHYATIPSARFLAEVSASDAEVKAYYDDHHDRYTTPETVTLEYITLSRGDFLGAAAPDDADLRARYDERVKAQAANEQRQAQHILIKVEGKKDADALKKIQEVEKRARAGEDFGKLAKEFSQDPGSVISGGDLGLASRGMFDPAFEKALYSLKEGEISGPVRSQHGYHVIKLNRIERPDVPAFAQLRPELEKEAREAKAEELFSDAVDKLDAAIYEASDLKEPAEKFGRSVATTAPFTRSGGPGIAADRKVLEAAFSDELTREGKNSQSLQLADGSVVWIRAARHVPATLRPLAEVSADVRNQILLNKAREKAGAVAAAVVKALGEGASLADVAAREKLAWQDVPGLTRRSTGLQPDVMRMAYRLPHPAAGKVSADRLDNGSAYVVVAVSRVVEGEPAPAAELGQVRNALSERRSEQELKDYVRFLREQGSVTVKSEEKAD
ncbi:MAG TPA: SurA N-terminal domain-containing protein [Moraxellaceae bacterium]|nr:SurA N-terminal domain-containing protein [Moraxellaceae bacterium]